MALGEVGTASTLYPSTGGREESRRDERRQNEDVSSKLKMQAQKPPSGLMKRVVKGSWEESRSHYWQGRSDKVMWEWILCKWHLLPVVSESCKTPPSKKKKKKLIASSHGWTFLAAAVWAHIRKPVKRTHQLFLCFPAPVLILVPVAPDAACLHVVHRWQSWPPGWRQPKPELFIFCKSRGGGAKKSHISQKSFRKVRTLRKHLAGFLQSAAEFDWQAPSDMWQLGIHAAA